jgi:hypothetical protein
LVAVTTATLLGVAMPVMVCGFEAAAVVGAEAPEPPQPASRATITAAPAMLQSLTCNLLKLISDTSVLEIQAAVPRA